MKSLYLLVSFVLFFNASLFGKFSYTGLYKGTSNTGWDIVFWVSSNNQIQFVGYHLADGLFTEFGEAFLHDNGTFDFTVDGARYRGSIDEDSFQGQVVGLGITFSGFRESDHGPFRHLYGGYWGSVGSVGNFFDYFSSFVMGISADGDLYCFFYIDGTTASGGIGKMITDTTFTFTEPGGSVVRGSFNDQIVNYGLSGHFDHPLLGRNTFNIVNVRAANHLVNISTRGQVGTRDNVMIAGFILREGGKTILIRGIGPSLSLSGVPGALQDPIIMLKEGQETLASNGNWQSNTNAIDIISTGLQPTDSREASLYVRLEPGAYTVILSGSGATTGVGLIEVFEVD